MREPGDAERALAVRAAGLRFADLDAVVVERIRGLILDHVGVAALGATRPHCDRLRDVEVDLAGGASQGADGVTVLGTTLRLPVDRAAFLNGVAGSSGPNLDDVCHGSLGHPGVGTLPAALTVGAQAGADGRALVEATAAGYEVAIRLGEAVGRSAFDRGWHPRGGCNAMAAAVAALRVVGCDDPQVLLRGMAHAANATGGLVGASYFADSWFTLSGHASRVGVQAARLALAGVTAPVGALDGPHGYLRATSDEPLVEALVAAPDAPPRLLDAGQKLYPSSGATHAALEATVAARGRLGCTAADVAAVEVAGFRQLVGVLGVPHPANAVAASMSVPYVVACGLIDGTFDLRHLEDDRLVDPVVTRLQDLVTLTLDARLDALPPAHLGARVTVRTRDGRSETVEVLTASGHPGRPLGRDDLVGKLRRLPLGADVVDRIAAACVALPDGGPAEVLAATVPVA